MSKYAHLSINELIRLIDDAPDNLAALQEFFTRTAGEAAKWVLPAPPYRYAKEPSNDR